MTDRVYTSECMVVEHKPEQGVCWVGVHKTPGVDEMDRIAEDMSKLFETQTCILHVEHVGPELVVPSFSQITHTLVLLNKYSELIHRSLLGTAIQYRRMDSVFQGICDLALTLYRPLKPLVITSEAHEVAAFIHQVSSSREKL